MASNIRNVIAFCVVEYRASILVIETVKKRE